MAFAAILRTRSHAAIASEGKLLSRGRDNTERLDRLIDELRPEPALTPYLISKVLAAACTRVLNLPRIGKTGRIERLMHAEAWTDMALSLIESELPMWRPRRLVYDGGEWLCSLSRHSELPIEVDDTADGRHETLAVAILLSFVEAKRLLTASERLSAPSVPQVRLVEGEPFCCDNFR